MTTRIRNNQRGNPETAYPACRSIVDGETWNLLKTIGNAEDDSQAFLNTLELRVGDLGLPPFLPELARLEWTFNSVRASRTEIPPEVDILTLNPTLQLLRLSWRHLTNVLNPSRKKDGRAPEPGEEFVLLWRNPETGTVQVRPASREDLLALKIIVEEIAPEDAAGEGDLSIGRIDRALDRAVRKGILLKPRSRIQRGPAFPSGSIAPDRFRTAHTFTLQWHVTQACDLHCKHCYDRSSRDSLRLPRAIEILDELRRFCRDRYVRGQITFSGGNPLLYPHFTELYRAASERGFSVAILGNPTPRTRIEELLEIQRPTHFQVSLEGLPEHNDDIRGPGNFESVIEFLHVLRDLNVYSMVMLTLTKENMNQIIPLAEMLRGKTDLFTFNRLSMVGEGANLRLPSPEEYRAFLGAYLKAAEQNPIMVLKDNLINIVRYEQGIDLFGGCAGFGCSAAFNFMTLLSDGEMHACRKFPSPIGNVMSQSIAQIYESGPARLYRAGCQSCRDCAIRPVCGGCMAVVHGYGMNECEERDPFCFIGSSM